MDHEFNELYNRLKKNLKQRKKLKSKTQAFRLYDKDLPQFPFIIDIYHLTAVIYEKGKKPDFKDSEFMAKREYHLSLVKKSLEELLPDSKQVFKTRMIQKGKNQYKVLADNKNFFVVKECGRIYLINPLDYLDCGLFLDHRPLRELIASKNLKDKKVLNLFSYTGSISVAAAMAQANVTSVDLSKTYIQWSKENFLANQIDPQLHQFVIQDSIEYLNNKTEDRFELIIIDPPTFSNSKKLDSDFSVQDQHEYLILKASERLTKSGTIYFSNNFRKFKMSNYLTENFIVKDISHLTIPEDFRDKKIHQCYEIKFN